MSLIDFNLEDSDCDSETELHDLQQLNAVLNSEIQPSSSTSQVHSATASFCTSSKTASEIDKVETAISLNKLTDEKLRRLENILVGRLQECNQKLEDIKKSKDSKNFDKQESFRYVNCGKPYFKDKANFTPPHNEDTIIMQNSGMYDFSLVTTVVGWTVKDKSLFLNLIKEISCQIRKKQIETQITQLKCEEKTNLTTFMESETNYLNEIKSLKKEIESLKKKTLKDLAIPITEEYDWEFIADKLNCRHSASEYQSLWKLFLHPSINKSSWSNSEHTNLQKIAFENNFEDWDDIANKLGTNRTGYQCFVYFRTNMRNTFTGQKWTKEEEEYLKRLVDFYREGNYIPWGKVATSMENRTKIQIYNKYSRLMEQRKGRFLAEEDAVILTCIDNFGPDFRRMTSYLPGRSLYQLRTRYQILAKKKESAVWTVEEDNKLIKLLANQKSPALYSSLTKHFPGKDRMHVRSRCITLIKWMKTHPNMDISKAPRRASRKLEHGSRLNSLNKAIENLKNRLQNEVEERKCRTITKNSSEDIIEEAIMTILLDQITKDEETKNIDEFECDESDLSDDTVILLHNTDATDLKKLLILLKSNLNKTKLAESEYCRHFPDLLKGEREVVKIKSYSRKEALKTVVKQPPDIFGGNKLQSLEYVLPPHYATILGCRQLRAWMSDKDINKGCNYNINVLIKKNPLLKEHFNLLMERFNSLFLWPLLLANQSPVSDNYDNEIVQTSRPSPKTCTANDSTWNIGIAIPELKRGIINKSIDLDEANVNKDQINIIEINIDESIEH